MDFGKLRPQIFVAIVGLLVFAGFGMYLDFPEGVIGTAVGGVIGLGMKLLESE